MGIAIVHVVLLIGQSSGATWGSRHAAYDNAPAGSSGAKTGESVTISNMHYAALLKEISPVHQSPLVLKQ